MLLQKHYYSSIVKSNVQRNVFSFLGFSILSQVLFHRTLFTRFISTLQLFLVRPMTFSKLLWWLSITSMKMSLSLVPNCCPVTLSPKSRYCPFYNLSLSVSSLLSFMDTLYPARWPLSICAETLSNKALITLCRNMSKSTLANHNLRHQDIIEIINAHALRVKLSFCYLTQVHLHTVEPMRNLYQQPICQKCCQIKSHVNCFLNKTQIFMLWIDSSLHFMQSMNTNIVWVSRCWNNVPASRLTQQGQFTSNVVRQLSTNYEKKCGNPPRKLRLIPPPQNF